MNTFKQIQQFSDKQQLVLMWQAPLYSLITESHNIEVYIWRKNTQVHFEKKYINPMQEITDIEV